MNRRRFVAVLGATTIAGSGLLGTGAFSQTAPQREVTIQVAEDPYAYLGLTFTDVVVDCAETITLVTIHNYLKHPIEINDIDLEYDKEHLTIENVSVPEHLETGQAGDVTVDISCITPEEQTSTITFSIDTRGDLGGVLAQDRSIDVTCWCPLEEETAWGYSGERDSGTATDPVADLPFSDLDIRRWGWYIEYEVGSDPAEVALWAGAGNYNLDSGYRVGEATIDIDDATDTLTVAYELSPDEDDDVEIVEFEEAHLYVDDTTERLAAVNAAPGQLGYGDADAKFESFEVDLTNVQPEGKDLSDADTLILAIHAVVLLHLSDD